MASEEGKSPAERNKMIVAVVLGALALISLAYMFLGSSSKSTTTTTTKTSPPPRASNSPVQADKGPAEDYVPQIIHADWPRPAVPEAERNIFAFYEPPPPTPKPVITPTPIPTPTPPQPNL